MRKQEPEKDNQDDKSKSEWARVWQLASLGWVIVISILVGLVIGLVLDEFFHTKPIMMIACVFMGAISGFITFFREVNKLR